MICVQCGGEIRDGAHYCGGCGESVFALSAGWIARRTVGGAMAGATGWLLAMAAGRVLAALEVEVGSGTHEALAGMISGVLLGMAGGLLERSSQKTLFGAAGGMIGGLAGGLAGAGVLDFQFPHTYVLSRSLLWLLGGGLVGAAAGLAEASWTKAAGGLLSGAFGGALGGALGAELYLAMNLGARQPSWFMGRVSEAFEGALFGAGVWFFVSVAKKLLQRELW